MSHPCGVADSSSTVGRFLTCDPIKDGRNWYAYCANSPLVHVDPDGRIIWKVAIFAVVKIAIALYLKWQAAQDIIQNGVTPETALGVVPGGKLVRAGVTYAKNDDKIQEAAQGIINWLKELGEVKRVPPHKLGNSDLILRSETIGGAHERKFRSDLDKPGHREVPHIHLEEFKGGKKVWEFIWPPEAR